jgi:hypothetical protein
MGGKTERRSMGDRDGREDNVAMYPVGKALSENRETDRRREK